MNDWLIKTKLRISARLSPTVLVLAVAIICAGSLHTISALKYRAVDIQDELVYLDHLVKVTEFDLGRSGDFYSAESIREVCDRNGQLDHPVFPIDYSDRCQSADPVAAFGVNYSWPLPVYFVVTGLATKSVTFLSSVVGLEPSTVSVARFFGSVWFAFGLVFTYLSVRRLGRSPSLVAPLGLGVAGLQSVLHQQSIINADGSSFALGALLFLVTLRYIQGDSRIVTLVAAAMMTALATNHHLVILLGCSVFLLLSVIRREQESKPFWKVKFHRRELTGLGVMAGVVVFSSIAWSRLVTRFGGVIYGASDTDPTPIQESLAQQYKANGFHWYQMFSAENATTFLVPHGDAFQPAQRFGGPYQTAAWLTVILLIGGVVASVLVKHDYPLVRRAGVAHLVAALTMPIFFVLYWNFEKVNDGVNPRFAISSFVLLISVTSAMFVDSKASRIVVWAVGLTTFTVAFLTNFVDFV